MEDLRSLTTDTAGELDILGHDSHTLGVDSTQVGIFEKTNQVSLSSFLEGQDGRSLESKIGLEILGDLTDKTLEGQLADEKVGGLLVTTDLTESDGSGTVTMRLLDSSGGGGRLSGSLGGELLTGSLSSSGFTCCLLGTSHFECFGCYCKLFVSER
jgi:histone H3